MLGSCGWVGGRAKEGTGSAGNLCWSRLSLAGAVVSGVFAK